MITQHQIDALTTLKATLQSATQLLDEAQDLFSQLELENAFFDGVLTEKLELLNDLAADTVDCAAGALLGSIHLKADQDMAEIAAKANADMADVNADQSCDCDDCDQADCESRDTSSPSPTPGAPIFEVKDSAGNVVFAVTPSPEGGLVLTSIPDLE